jgi:NADPH:quinone reductase-like Zn-dependent oxidoreductase
MAGTRADVDLHVLMRKRARIHGTVLGGRPLEDKIAAARSFERHVVPLFESGALRPVVDCVLPWTQAGDAFRRLESNATFGKVVLRLG